MRFSLFLFVAYSLIPSAACEFGIAGAGSKRPQSDPGRLPVKFQFRANYDPGHGGLLITYTLERKGGKFLVDISEFNPLEYEPEPPAGFPPPIKKKPAPERPAPKERSSEEAERFLSLLVNDIKIGEMKDLKTPFFLHPTIYDFEIRYADGRVHRFEYMIEIDHHLDERYRRLVEECKKFSKIK